MRSIFNLRLIVLVLVFFAAASAAAGCSLAEDITPPPNYRPPTAAPAQSTVEPVSAALPDAPADLAQGQAIYAAKCAACHGDTGMGDGPQASKLQNPPAPIGNPDLSRSAVPADWFQVVTSGRIERFMPGFSGSLNAAQRWDVVAYALSLSLSPHTVDQGKELYTANCAACHGAEGRGDGEKAAGLSAKLADWTVPAALAEFSDASIAELIAQGKGEMPAIDKLSEDQRWVLASYTRRLSFGSPGAQQAAAQPTPETANTPAPADPGADSTLSAITISGQITSASSGGAIPSGVKVNLVGYDGSMAQVLNVSTEANPDGSYEFKDVAFAPTNVYMASAEVNGIAFNSDILHGSDVADPVVSLPIQVYETSTDLSQVKADRMHVFFDFSKPGIAQVVELFIVSNPTDKVIVSPEKDGAVLTFDLPEGATNLQFQDSAIGQRYIETDKGFGDRESILPGQGQHQVLFAYDMPYTSKAAFSIVAPLPVDAAMIMVPQSGVSLKSDQLADAGDQSVQGMNFRLYQSTGPIQPNQPVKLELNGSASGSPAPEPTLTSYLPLILGAAGFLLVAAGAFIWYLRRRKELQPAYVDAGAGEEGGAESSDSLLDAIVALDDQYQAGGLAETAYQERRAQLKARLAEALGKKQ